MTSRVPLLAGNWKMHGTPAEAVALATELRDRLADVKNRDILVAPAFPALSAVSECLKGSHFLLAGQNLHWEEKGAFTGEVSGAMLVGAGCSHVIVGHSERRHVFGESDENVARKTKAALRDGLIPIVCVGETGEQRANNETLAVIERQLSTALAGLQAEQLHRSVVAYEPVWAIGTGHVATPQQAQEVHATIRRLLGGLVNSDVAAVVRILYGGSVKPENIDTLMAQADVDGALVGGASLKAGDFERIVRFES
jgi:triosephosphate isomerase